MNRVLRVPRESDLHTQISAQTQTRRTLIEPYYHDATMADHD